MTLLWTFEYKIVTIAVISPKVLSSPRTSSIIYMFNCEGPMQLISLGVEESFMGLIECILNNHLLFVFLISNNLIYTSLPLT